MKKLLLVLSCAGVCAIAGAQTLSDAERFAPVINPATLKEKLTIIASAEMQGRETATPGQKKAAAYIESQFKRMGLLPGANGGYQQRWPVYIDSITAAELTVNGKPLSFGTDYRVNAAGMTALKGTYTGVVFAGFGVVDSASGYDNYANVDAKGKVVLITEGLPKADDGSVIVKNPVWTGRGAMQARLAAARAHGAALVLYYTAPNAIGGFNGRGFGGMNSRVSQMYTNMRSGGLNMITLTQSGVEQLESGLKANLDAQSASGKAVTRVIPVTFGVTLDKNTQQLESSNVVGVLPGTDKKDEYVLLTGHYDHLGHRGDSVIYYGADDDGSGTTTVLQMAEAFTKAKAAGKGPRRTIVFMTVSGEEKGLWGSEYYSEHPLFPLDKTSIDLNTDMDGRTDTERHTDSTNYIYVIGHDKLSSDLAKINSAVNDKYTHLVLDYKFDDPADKNRIYYRSDHFNFAKKGVPILFFYDGMLLADYHKPTDTVDKINFDLMARRAQLVYYTAWDMANRDDMLKRDMPLNMPATRQ